MVFLVIGALILSGCASFPSSIRQEDEGKTIFEKMRKTIMDANTLQGSHKSELLVGGKQHSNGVLYMKKGNRVHLTNEVKAEDYSQKFKGTSNGDNIRIGSWHSGEGYGRALILKSPAKLGEKAREALASAGIPFMQDNMRHMTYYKRERDIMVISDYKLINKVILGRRDAQILEYQCSFSSALKEGMKIRLWIDVETSLPLKRVIDTGEGKERLVLEETYDLRIDEDIPESQFSVK